MKSVGVPRPYAEVLSEFASTGASLIRQSIGERYRGRVPEGTRLLEPGYIPLDRPARVLIVSYFPNASDLDKPGTPGHERVRSNLEAWGRSGTVDDYRVTYADWLSYLDRIPFHRQRTKPILDAAGLSNNEIGWLPFVKAPMPAGSSPGDEVIDVDIDETWAQLQLLRPNIVWIQGIKVADRVMGLVKDRITEKVLPPQSVSQYLTGSKLQEERARLSRRLIEFLSESSSRI